MNKPTCENCRYYLDADDTKGYCGNVRVGRIVRAAAHACPYYEPERTPKGKRNDMSTSGT